MSEYRGDRPYDCQHASDVIVVAPDGRYTVASCFDRDPAERPVGPTGTSSWGLAEAMARAVLELTP